MSSIRQFAIVAVVLILSLAPESLAQPYTIPVGNSAPDISGIDPSLAVFGGTSKWGDYDKDGFLDFVLTGRMVDNTIGFEPLVGAIFKGIPPAVGGATISYIQYSVVDALWLSDVEWGDYDNDGDLDLVMIGSATAEKPYSGVAFVYRNEETAVAIPNFTQFNLPINGVYSGSVDWGDYDNDGDLDLLITGVTSPGENHTELLRNDGNDTFTPVASGLPDVGFGDARFADVDNDADLDIVLTGALSSDVLVADVFQNSEGAFTSTSSPIEPALFGKIDFADYDEDGDNDMLISGGSPSPLVFEASTRIYNNDASGNFLPSGHDLVDLYGGDAGFVDYDNDGDIDVYETGSEHPFTTGTTIMNASINNGSSFVRTNLLTSGLGAAPFPGSKSGTISFGDYDGDTDLDIMLTGIVADSIFLATYNNLGGFNTRPQEPANLTTTVSGADVTFSWSAPVDGQTNSASLTYNIRIGTAPVLGDVVAPPSYFNRGNLAIPASGDITSTEWIIRGLPPGTYYWSVQSVDWGFYGSTFPSEQQVIVP